MRPRVLRKILPAGCIVLLTPLLVYGGFRVVVAPKGTPQPIVEHLEKTLYETWNDPKFQSLRDPLRVSERSGGEGPGTHGGARAEGTQ